MTDRRNVIMPGAAALGALTSTTPATGVNALRQSPNDEHNLKPPVEPRLSLMPISINHRRSSALHERLSAEAFATAAAVRCRMQHSPINCPAILKCSRCGRTKYTQHLIFKQNVSYFFARKERQFSGDLCFSCASRTFASVELTTLFLTWWGIIGFWLGPLYIVHNLVEYIIATFRFVRSEKYIREGLLRLCVAAGVAWIGWLGYKSLDALADGSGWDTSIVWLSLTVSIGAPILTAWVVAGFQK